MNTSHSKALELKKGMKEKSSEARRYFREKGYSKAKEKSYYDYSHKERKNIRDNAKPNSAMHKWAGSSPDEKKSFAKKVFGQ